MKKHISQLLRALNRDSEENEEYSEQEWEEIPRPKSRVKGERFNLVISIWLYLLVMIIDSLFLIRLEECLCLVRIFRG